MPATAPLVMAAWCCCRLGVAVELCFAEETACVPVDAVPVDAVPVDAVPVDAVPVDAVPVDAVPVDAVPVGAFNGITGVVSGGTAFVDEAAGVGGVGTIVSWEPLLDAWTVEFDVELLTVSEIEFDTI
jgi:hypothetical protein